MSKLIDWLIKRYGGWVRLGDCVIIFLGKPSEHALFVENRSKIDMGTSSFWINVPEQEAITVVKQYYARKMKASKL